MSKRPFKQVIESVPPEKLTVGVIRQLAEGFNYSFNREGGYKNFEVRAIEALLAHIVELERLVAQGCRVAEDFLPNVGSCAIQDYKGVNELFVTAAKLGLWTRGDKS